MSAAYGAVLSSQSHLVCLYAVGSSCLHYIHTVRESAHCLGRCGLCLVGHYVAVEVVHGDVCGSGGYAVDTVYGGVVHRQYHVVVGGTAR